jgi:PAS domain S-box-containing protein
VPTNQADETELFRRLFHANADALFVHSASGRVVLVNEQMCSMFRCTPEQAYAAAVNDFSANVAPYTQVEARQYGIRTVNEGACTFEWRSRRLDGSVFWSEVAMRTFDVGGKTRFISCVRNTEQRRQVDEALLESRERFGAIFQNMSSMVAFTEPREGRILDVNTAWLAATGLSREDVIGKTGEELGLGTDPAARKAILEQLAEHGRVHDLQTTLELGGRHVPILMSANLVALRGERYILWETRDLSERKRGELEKERLREQLQQAQKMESVGRLAGGIAHDFNNLLTVINGCASLLEMDLESASTDTRAMLSDILRAGSRAAELTRQLLSFSRQEVIKQSDVSLHAVVTETLHLLARLIGEDVELVVALADDLPLVRADAGLLSQVIMNLAVNARDAMPQGGRLTIETANVAVTPELAEWSSDASAGDFVRLTISDTGIGMDAETKQRLFEPFFTTKRLGQGTGLGLSTVYGIVQQLGGWISVHSELGLGTSLQVFLPQLQRASDTAIGGADAVGDKGTETILLVEDQIEVRRVTSRAMQRQGYTVLEASNADDALTLVSLGTQRIDILVTDVVMPGVSGRVLSERLRALYPQLKVLFISGYTDDIVVHHGLLDGSSVVLEKPFSPAQLGRKLRQVLDRPAATHGERAAK